MVCVGISNWILLIQNKRIEETNVSNLPKKKQSCGGLNPGLLNWTKALPRARLPPTCARLPTPGEHNMRSEHSTSELQPLYYKFWFSEWIQAKASRVRLASQRFSEYKAAFVHRSWSNQY